MRRTIFGWLTLSAPLFAMGCTAGNGGESAVDAGDTNRDRYVDTDVDSDSDVDTDPDSEDSEQDTAFPPSTNYAVEFADMVIDTWPDPRYVAGRLGGWDYNNGIVLRGMAEVFEMTGDTRYDAYIRRYVDEFVDGSGNLYVDEFHNTTIENATHNLDTIQPSVLLMYLRKHHPEDARYAAAAARVRNLYDGIPTNTQGGYWHKDRYPNEMWLDGLYMAQPFIAWFGQTESSCGNFCFDTPVFQMTLLADRVRLPGGLFLHGWDEDNNATWCVGGCEGSSGTGLSPEVWSRATGWFAMALVDTIRYLPNDHAGRETLSALLREVAEGIAGAQDPDSGLWCQVVDKCGQSDNWLESSGSAMFIYALKRGVDLGVLNASYLDVAATAWEGLIANMISESSGQPVIENAAEGMSIQQNYDAYISIDRLSNSAHGLCAVLLAASAMEY